LTLFILLKKKKKKKLLEKKSLPPLICMYTTAAMPRSPPYGSAAGLLARVGSHPLRLSTSGTASMRGGTTTSLAIVPLPIQYSNGKCIFYKLNKNTKTINMALIRQLEI